MGQTSVTRQWIILVAPIAIVALLSFLDRDFLFTLPLTALAAGLVAGLAFIAHPNGQWPILGLLGGIVGFVASILLMMNLTI